MRLMSEVFGKKGNKLAVLVAIPLALLLFMTVMIYSSKAFATEEYWLVQANGNDLAVLSSETEAKQVVDGVKKAYVTKGSKVESVTTDKELEVVHKNFKSKKSPEIMSTDKAVDKITKGVKAPKKYVVKEGDTAWNIAVDNGLKYDEFLGMNKGYDPEGILPGDEVIIEKQVPYVNVKTVEVFKNKETVTPDIQYEDTDSLYEGETKVKEQGENGSKDVTTRQTNLNGVVTDSKTLKETVTVDAKPQIVLRGTKKRPVATSNASGGSSYGGGYSGFSVPSAAGYSGSGSSVASYACQFVGAPYVWGGTNLRTGVDCSGFVVAVYRALGYNITRSFASYGRYVSPSQMQPGDIISYRGHYSIYVGGGREVHALNPSLGVKITSLGWARVGPIQAVIRIVE